MSEFSIEFEEEVLASCLAVQEYLAQAAPVLRSHHFATKHHAWIWGAIEEAWERKELVHGKALIKKCKREFSPEDGKPYLELYRKLLKLKPKSPKTALKELTEFVRYVMLQAAMEDAVKDLKGGKVDEAYGKVGEVIRSSPAEREYETIEWVDEFEARQAERKHRRDHPELYPIIPTGFPTIDRAIRGIQMPEIGIVMGTTGKGKSIFLNRLGWAAAKRGYGVLHVPVEMPGEQVAQRYDTIFMNRKYDDFKFYDFKDEDLAVMKRRLEKNRKRFKNMLTIAKMPLKRVDADMVARCIQAEREAGKDIKLIILDSADHFKPRRSYREKRVEHAEVYWEVKCMADELGVAVWTSTHAGREWASKIATAEASAESYDKSRIVDIIFTLNEPEEKSRSKTVVVSYGAEDEPEDDEDGAEDGIKTPRLQLFVAKYRDGKSKFTVELEYDFARMMIREPEGS